MQRAEGGRLAEHPIPSVRIEFVAGTLERDRIRAKGAAERAAVGEFDEHADRRLGRRLGVSSHVSSSHVSRTLGLEVAEHGDDVLLDDGLGRIVPARELGNDRFEISLAVAELKHRRGRRVDLEDALRREQGPASAHLVAPQFHAARQTRSRKGAKLHRRRLRWAERRRAERRRIRTRSAAHRAAPRARRS